MKVKKIFYCNQLNNFKVCAFGAVAGASSVLGNNPIDVVKTRVQTGAGSSSLMISKDIMRTDGIRGFYRGVLPRLNRVTIEVALAFCIYDIVVHCINKIQL